MQPITQIEIASVNKKNPIFQISDEGDIWQDSPAGAHPTSGPGRCGRNRPMAGFCGHQGFWGHSTGPAVQELPGGVQCVRG